MKISYTEQGKNPDVFGTATITSDYCTMLFLYLLRHKIQSYKATKLYYMCTGW